MTSSGASDRTPPPSALSRPVAGSAPNLLKRFFVMCSGATPELLYAPNYLTELNKYALLGALICFTAGVGGAPGGDVRSGVVIVRIRPSATRQSPPRSVCCGGCSFLRWIDSSCQGYENSNMSPTIPGLCGWASLSEKSYRRSPDLSLLFFSPSSLRHP